MTMLSDAPLEIWHPTDVTNLVGMVGFDMTRLNSRVQNCSLMKVKISERDFYELKQAHEKFTKILADIEEINND